MKTDDGLEHERACRELIGGYVHRLESRAPVLERLFREGYPREAMLLCCCYIESLGNICFTRRGSAYAFVHVLLEYSGEPVFSYVHPSHLSDALRTAKSSKLKGIGLKLDAALPVADDQLYTMDDIAALATHILTEEEQPTLDENLWRGTIAAIAHKVFRCDLVHALSSPDTVTFATTTPAGHPAPPLDFALVYRALRAVLQGLRQAFPFPVAR